jgi:hypothetical protein
MRRQRIRRLQLDGANDTCMMAERMAASGLIACGAVLADDHLRFGDSPRRTRRRPNDA